MNKIRQSNPKHRDQLVKLGSQLNNLYVGVQLSHPGTRKSLQLHWDCRSVTTAEN